MAVRAPGVVLSCTQGQVPGTQRLEGPRRTGTDILAEARGPVHKAGRTGCPGVRREQRTLSRILEVTASLSGEEKHAAHGSSGLPAGRDRARPARLTGEAVPSPYQGASHTAKTKPGRSPEARHPTGHLHSPFESLPYLECSSVGPGPPQPPSAGLQDGLGLRNGLETAVHAIPKPPASQR